MDSHQQQHPHPHQQVYHPQPSVPLSTDFDFTFDPSLFPAPPPLPSSADLFTASETSDLFGFLDNFNFDLETDPNALFIPELLEPTTHQPPVQGHAHSARSPPPYSNPHLNTAPEPGVGSRNSSSRGPFASSVGVESVLDSGSNVRAGRTPTARSSLETVVPTPRASTSSTAPASVLGPASDEDAAAKLLLSTPQKRLNHIMSEQKRRNAIRDGYAQLISLIAPAGSAHAIAMPSRGRPKGSGGRGKNRTQGKSGVLFRAVEYVRYLEEGRGALLEEVLRLEALAGIKSEPRP